MRCPNIRHPDWVKLVTKVGLNQAYLEYARNNYDIPNPENVIKTPENVNFVLKSIPILLSQKADEIFRKGDKNDWTLEKILTELNIPKEQQEILKQFDTRNREELLTSLLTGYSYTIKVNTAKNKRSFTEDRYSDYENQPIKDENTQYYSNLTVPGGTNYTENEIATPAITPSIKGHAQFSTGNGIGWFRSDEQLLGQNTIPNKDLVELKVIGYSERSLGIDKSSGTLNPIKTRRILEVQSDLFQKGRDKTDLISREEEYLDAEEAYQQGLGTYNSARSSNIQQNQFLQLLNKDNNWISFFIKAIIQDSAKKGYEKVVFPSGNTASKVEGHTTLEEFKKQKEDRLKTLNIVKDKLQERKTEWNITIVGKDENYNVFVINKLTEEEYGFDNEAEAEDWIQNRLGDKESDIIIEINQLKQELEQVEKEGFGALRPIFNFYENQVKNILKKNYEVKEIIDEYGNTWNEVTLTQKEKDESIQFDLPSSNVEKSELLLDGFEDFYQQQEAVNLLFSSILNYFDSNPNVKAGRVKKAVETFKTNIDNLNKTQPNKGYEAISKNIKALEELAITKLQKLDQIRKPKQLGITFDKFKQQLVDDDIDLDAMSGQDAINSWKDEWVFQYDAKDNAMKEVKSFLARTIRAIYDVNEKAFYDVESFIPDQPSFMSYDEVYEQLKAILSDTDNTWEAMEKVLQEHQTSKPFIYNLLTYQFRDYKGDKEQLKRQFVSTMSGSYGGFKTILISPKYQYYKDESGNWQRANEIVGYYFNTIDTDQSSVVKTIVNRWSGDFKRSNLFKTTETGDLVVDSEKVDKYLEKIKETAKAPTVENISSLLKEIGIELSEATLDQLVNKAFNKKLIGSQFTDEKNGLFKLIELRLTSKKKVRQETEDTSDETEDQEDEDKDSLDINNPIVNNSIISSLARLESTNSDNYYSNTFKDTENKTIYSYTFNKFLTKEFNKLKDNPEYVKQLLEITFNKPILKDGEPIYSTWLNRLNTSEVFKEIFSISPFDGLKLKTSKEGTKLSSMSNLEIELANIAFIQNSGASRKGVGRVIKYLLTIPDKSTSYTVQGSGIDLKLQFNKNGEYTIDSATKDALYSIAATEHNRILSQQARKSKNNAYAKGSKFFYFFPSLNNDENIFNPDETIKLPTTLTKNNITVEQYIRTKVEELIRQNIKDKVVSWKQLGIINQETELRLVDQKYKEKILDNQTTDKTNQATLAAADYIIQSMLAKFNTHQLFINDPAIYFNLKKPTVDEAWENVGKRLTNLIAPFKEGLIDNTNKRFLSVKLKDRKAVAANIVQLRERLKSHFEDKNIELPYESITGTDAQELTTLKEDLIVKYMYGEIPTDTFNELIRRIDKDKDDLVLNDQELELLFGPSKPVYSSRTVNKADDAVYSDYIKSAAFPLLPQFTKDLQIDKLRKSMEALERSTGLSVRAVYDSGTKLGGKGSIDIWNEDGTIKDNLDLTEYAVELDRSNFGIQQPVPYDEDYDQTVKSIQVTKLLFNAVQDLTGLRLDNKAISGKALFDLYIDLHKQLYKKGLTTIETKLVQNNEFNIPALQEQLLTQAVEREYSDAQKSFLALNENKTDFKIPFWSHIANDKEQALITSLYTNTILKQTMNGSSYVLVAEEGMQGKSPEITYIRSIKTKTVDKENAELLSESVPKELKKQLVSITSTDPTDNSETLEEQPAEEAVEEIKKQHNRLEELLKCLTK